MSDPISDEFSTSKAATTAVIDGTIAEVKKLRKRGGVKKKARKSRRLSWHLAFIDQLTPILHKILIETLEKLGGVKSFNDFHAKFQDTHNCTIDIDIFRDVVMQNETLAPLFSRINLIVLPTAINLSAPRQTPNDATAFIHPLSEGLDSIDNEDTPPGTLDVNFRPIKREVGGHGLTTASVGDAASAPWSPPPDPMAVRLDPTTGRPVIVV